MSPHPSTCVLRKKAGAVDITKLVLTNVRAFVGGADLTTDINKAEITAQREAKETTNYGSNGWRERIAGLGSSDLNLEGFFEASATPATQLLEDDAAWAALGLVNSYMICPVNAADQAVAYFTNRLATDYAILGQVGDVAPFKLTAQSTWPLVRGVVGAPPAAALTTTGNGTANNLGQVLAGQNVYVDAHVVSVSGTTPSITLALQSATSGAFTSPTTRATLTAMTGLGNQIVRVPGPITDTWWRLTWTISGTTPSFLVAAGIGIA